MNELKIELFEKRLNDLKSDSKISRNVLRTIIETLIKIYKNLVTNKDNEKYRKINTKNENFCQNVWTHSMAKELLLSCGWAQTVNDFIAFDPQSIDVSKCLQLLLDNRDIRPDSKDWINSDNKFVNPVKTRDEELRQLAQKERFEEMAEFERNRRQTKLLAENVKKEIESDIRHRKWIQEKCGSNEALVVSSTDTPKVESSD